MYLNSPTGLHDRADHVAVCLREYGQEQGGFVSKGEMRLAQKNISMKDLAEILQELDNDGDGKLTFDEI